MSAAELEDWKAYFEIKKAQEDEAAKRAEIEAKAKQRAGNRRWTG